MRSILPFLACLALTACRSDALDLPGGDPPGGTDGCESIHDANACQADARCYWDGCQTCDGSWTVGSGCWAKDGPVHTSECAEPACAIDCSKIVQPQTCDATPGCEAVPGCCGFPTCHVKGEPQTDLCPRTCPASCQGQHDEASCNGESPIQGGGCHATFLYQPIDCAAPGCDLKFATCQPGSAICVPTPRTGPCPAEPSCAGDFVAEYDADGCVIDCVRASSCRSAG